MLLDRNSNKEKAPIPAGLVYNRGVFCDNHKPRVFTASVRYVECTTVDENTFKCPECKKEYQWNVQTDNHPS